MKTGLEVRVGNVLRLEGKICKVVSQEVRGTGKFGKTVHVKLKSLPDGHTLERSLKGDDKFEEVEVTHTKMQYLYKDGSDFVFMNNENYEQFTIPSSAVGQQEVFLTENMEIDVEFIEEKPASIRFPETAELKVTSTPPGTKGGNDSTYKEAELENGLKVLVPQFVKEGESVKINVHSLEYLERVSTKSMKHEPKKD